MQTENSRPLFTIRDVAGVLNVSTRGLRKLVADGRFPQPIRVGRLLRWPEATVQEWIARQQEQRR